MCAVVAVGFSCAWCYDHLCCIATCMLFSNHHPSKLVLHGCLYTPLARLTLSLVSLQQHHYTCRVRRLGALWCACAARLQTHYILTHACLLQTLLHATHPHASAPCSHHLSTHLQLQALWCKSCSLWHYYHRLPAHSSTTCHTTIVWMPLPTTSRVASSYRH